MNDTIHVINLSKRKDRAERIIQQSKDMHFSVMFWEGVIDPVMPFRGICRAFKKIVQYAKDNKMPYIFIAEDDLEFTHPDSYKFFLRHRPSPLYVDLYFSMIYEGTINEDNRITSWFTGMTLFMVTAKFYDFFLNIRETNNIDRELGKFSKEKMFLVCPEFVAYQANGYSDNKGADATYDHLLIGRKMFNG